MAKVSIIIPIYNVEKYLRQCLDSVINQTFKDIEIIIVNDCSPDNSLEIIKEYQQKDKRIVLVDLKQNIGLGFARNEGMKVAKSKYITFVDSDDWVADNFIETLYNTIEKYDVDFVSASYYFFYNNKIVIPSFRFKFYNKIISDRYEKFILNFNQYYHSVCIKIFKRELILKNKLFFRVKIFEDALFSLETVIKSNNFMIIPNKIYYYRRNNFSSIMNNDELFLFDKYFELFREIKNMLTDIKKQDEYIEEFYICISLLFCVRVEDSNLSFSELRQIFNKFKILYYKDLKIIIKKLVFNKGVELKHKIRLFLFFLCLKFNINYAFIACYPKKIFYFFKIIK